LLHGLGSNEHDLFALAPRLDECLFIISVRAPLTYAWGGYMWFDVERHGPALGSESIESGLALLGDFLGQIEQEYPIDAKRLFLGGFSMGAAMAGATLLLHPEKLAGAIMTSGFLPPDPTRRYRLSEAAGRPLFQAHGLYDPVIPLAYAHQTRDFLQTTPVDLEYHEYPIGHQVSEEELLDLSTWLEPRLKGN
jgi:phospholipase/carboxylesterase